MVILEREMNAAFEKYLKECLVTSRVEPEWLSSCEIPYGTLGWHRFDRQQIPQISINPDLQQNVFEYAAAHELGHIVQFYEGYPQLQSMHIPTNIALSQALRAIADVVTDLVADPDTERRLKPYGLWVSGRYDFGFENLKTQLPQATPDLDMPARPLYVVNAVQYAYAKTMLTESQWQTIGELYRRHLPGTSNLGNRIYKRLPDGACDTEMKTRQAYQDIFQELGLDHLFRFAPVDQKPQ